MKFIKLLLLVVFSFLSAGLNASIVRADEGTGYGYGYDCDAPYSRIDGTVGCGDEEIPPFSPDAEDCVYTTSGGSVCAGEPEIITVPESNQEFGWGDHAAQAVRDGLPSALGGAIGGAPSGPGGAAAGAVGGFVGGAVQGCINCHSQ